MALSEQQDEALKDLPALRTEMEKAQKEASIVKREHDDLVGKVRIFEAKNDNLLMMTKNTTSQVQEKIELIDQLWAEMDEIKATTEALRGRMDLLASEKEATKEELVLVKDQLRVVKDKADKWSWLNDELLAHLYLAVRERDALDQEYTALTSKLEATS